MIVKMVMTALLGLGLKAEMNQEDVLLGLLNEQRGKAGVQPLKRVALLDRAARWFAQDLALNHEHLDHVDSLGRRVQHRIYEFGYRSIERSGENLARGLAEPSDVLRAWMSSSGHRRNALDPNFQHIGIGVYKDKEGRTFWVAEFGQRFKGAPALLP